MIDVLGRVVPAMDAAGEVADESVDILDLVPILTEKLKAAKGGK